MLIDKSYDKKKHKNIYDYTKIIILLIYTLYIYTYLFVCIITFFFRLANILKQHNEICYDCENSLKIK